MEKLKQYYTLKSSLGDSHLTFSFHLFHYSMHMLVPYQVLEAAVLTGEILLMIGNRGPALRDLLDLKEPIIKFICTPII